VEILNYYFQKKKKKKKKDEKKKNLLKNYNFGLTYQNENLLLAALVEKSLSTAKIGVQHSVDKKTTLGFEFLHKLKKDEKDKTAFQVSAGFSREIDDQSNVRAKLLSTGIVSVAYQVKIKPDVTATVSLEQNMKELSKEGKIGVELSFEPLD